MSLNLRSDITEHISKDIQSLFPEAGSIELTLEEPNIEEHGDLATNIALQLAKPIQRKPLEIAEELLAHMQQQSWFQDYFETGEVKAPGFINLFYRREMLLSKLASLVTSLSDISQKNEKIVIEHTSVNPNKAMHIGHLRNSVLGDVMRRVWQRMGYTTEVQYYVDDTGLQVVDTTLGLRELSLAQEKGEKFDHFCWRVYTAINDAYEKNPELLEKRKELLHALEAGDNDDAQKAREQSERIIADHLTTLAEFNVSFDLLAWESDILGLGFWEAAFERLKQSDVFIKEESGKNAGCWVIKMDEEDDNEEHSKDKIIVRSDGTVTYTGKDLAYNFWKFNLLGKDFLYREWKNAPQDTPLTTTDTNGKKSDSFGHADAVYTLIDVRQTYPQQMIKRALESLGYDTEAAHFHHASYGVVSLSKEAAKNLGVTTDAAAKAYSMSGRKGIGVKIDDLLDEVEKHVAEQAYDVTANRSGTQVSPRSVAVGAIKYYMLRYNQHTDIVFDYADALTLEGNTGPYLMYAHARAAGILSKAAISKMPAISKSEVTDEEARMLKKVYEWPSVLLLVSGDQNLSRITTYAFELANAFNRFYEAVPVMKADDADRSKRLAIVHAFKETLGDVLDLLGIEAPDTM